MSLWQGRKGQAAAIDEYLKQPDVPEVNTRTFSQPVFDPNADPKKFFTEGLPAAYGAAKETLAKPTYGQTLQQRYPWTKYTTAPALLHVGEFASRLPQAFGAGVAELGPEKAKPLTEAMASNLPFLYQRKPPAPLPRTVAADYEANVRRALPPGEQGQLVGGQRALPAAPPEGPTVPSFWPNPASLPPKTQGQLPGRLYTPQLPPRRLGEDLRSRTYFPEKTPYQPEKPLEVKGGAREGELLDQYGRPVKAPEGTMPERERLRTLYKGRIGTGPTEAERLESKMRDVATEGGGQYVGIQSIQGRPMYVSFNEPKYGSTVMLPIDEATPAAVRAKLADKVRSFEAAGTKPLEAPPEPPVKPPEPSPKPIEEIPRGQWQKRPGKVESYLSEDKRFIATKAGKEWHVSDKERVSQFPQKRAFDSLEEAKAWAKERQESTAAAAAAKAKLPVSRGNQQPTESWTPESLREEIQRLEGRLEDPKLAPGMRETVFDVIKGHRAEYERMTTPEPHPSFMPRYATGAEPRTAPFVEKTKIGDQSMIGGTEARAIPTSKLLSKAPQSKLSESPLFAKPETAVQQPLAEAPSMADAIMAQLGPETEKVLASAKSRLGLPPAVRKQLADMGIDAETAMGVAKRRQSAQAPLEPPPVQKGYAGQHYGKTVTPGTAMLSDAEEVRILLRDMGGIKPNSIGLDVAATPKEFLNPAGRNFDEIVTEIAEAQGKKPKDVERELGRTLSRYSTIREEMKGEGLMKDIRGAQPPPDVAVSPEEWQQMGPADRRAAVEWYRIFTDESGAMNIGAMIDAWKKFRRRLPMEEAVRKVVPDSPAISEVERWNVGLADGIKAVASSPWWKAIRKMNPETIKDIDEALVTDWLGRIPAALRARMQSGATLTPAEVAQLQTARSQAIAAQAPADLRASMARRDVQFGRENQSRAYFSLEPIPEEYGPYLPRRTDAEAREAVSLGGGRLGVGRGLQTTVRGHQQERVFESYRQGESAGTVYEDPRNAIIMREWEGLKLRSTHRLFANLEAKGVLFRDRAAATAASPTRTPWKVENAPGGTWFARTEEEARFLQQNLTESSKGPTGSFVHYGNQLIRNPSLVNPMPHIVKNMWAKALLARGPVGLYTVPRDAVEYFRGANPTLIREFKDAMPFSSSGRTAGEILGNELRQGPVGEAVKTAGKVLGAVNRPSSRVIFEWADPAMRYSLFKHYRGQGLTPYAAANHAWVDLIRYGTRSDLIDFWKAIPMNFFVPWRYGTLTALLKQAKNHPVRTALTVAAIDYLRESRYRSSGKYTHLPWDYTENPLAIVIQNAQDGKKDAKQQASEAFGIAVTTRVFGPGGAFAAGQLVDTLNDIRGKGDWERAKNMFWGLSQLYNLKDEWKSFQETGDVKYLAEMVPTIVLGEHKALSYQPRRLMRDLPEWLPGMQRSPLVQQAEELQRQREEKSQRLREHRQEKPRSTIEDKLRDAGYLK